MYSKVGQVKGMVPDLVRPYDDSCENVSYGLTVTASQEPGGD